MVLVGRTGPKTKQACFICGRSSWTFINEAGGLPYYPFLMYPTLLDPSYYEGYPIFTNTDDLGTAIESGEQIDPEELLESFYSLKQYPNPSQRFWEVMTPEHT